MIHNIEISTMDDLFRMVSNQEYREDLGRHRNLFVYRGEPDASFVLSTSLRRNCKEKSALLEPPMLLNFTKYAILEEPSIEASIWNQMILGQHHGLPTRLLDWSFSPLTSLHFALSEYNLDKMDDHDCIVWRIDVNELHELLPEKYQRVMEKEGTTVFSLKMLQEACSGPEEYDEDMKDQAMLIVEPPSLEQRITNQYSFFAIIPSDMEDIEKFLAEHTRRTVKYVIKKELRWQARDLLDQLNISERTIYPGLDGLSKWIERHYYVKE